MAEYIIKSIKKESRARYGDASNSNGRSFCVGATASIRRRIDDIIAHEAEKTEGTGTALAIINLRKSEMTENESWLASEGTALTTSKRKGGMVKSNAFNAGKDFGQKVSLNTQLTGGTSPTLLKLR